MFYTIYLLLSCFFFIVAFPFFLLHSIITGRNRTGLGQRLGRFDEAIASNNESKECAWIHAASVGEVQVAKAFIKEIQNSLPGIRIVVSTVTEQGQLIAKKQLGPEIKSFFAPVDIPFAVRKALKTIKPKYYICLETELWPTMIREADSFGSKLFLLNGRISNRSFRRYKIIRGLTSDLLKRFSAISVIQEEDAKRFAALGADADKIEINGNSKYDLLVEQSDAIKIKYKSLLNLSGRHKVLIAGSTHKGEEDRLISAYNNVKQTIPDLIVVIAPRHIERIAEVEKLLDAQKTKYQKLSHLKNSKREADLILVDTMGELAGLYSIGSFAFCGGSLVPRGGHNILEAAIWGNPVFYGPSMNDFDDAKSILEKANGGFEVKDAEELFHSIRLLIEKPDEYKSICENAKQAALSQKGSVKKQIQLFINRINASVTDSESTH